MVTETIIEHGEDRGDFEANLVQTDHDIVIIECELVQKLFLFEIELSRCKKNIHCLNISIKTEVLTNKTMKQNHYN